MTSMEDNIKGRPPQWKTISMEDNLNEVELNVRRRWTKANNIYVESRATVNGCGTAPSYLVTKLKCYETRLPEAVQQPLI